MNIEETYNIHKKINCVFPHFKSKWLCKHNKHNYQLHSRIEIIPEIEKEFDPRAKIITHRVVYYNKIWKTYWKCYCCGKEIDDID